MKNAIQVIDQRYEVVGFRFLPVDAAAKPLFRKFFSEHVDIIFLPYSSPDVASRFY